MAQTLLNGIQTNGQALSERCSRMGSTLPERCSKRVQTLFTKQSNSKPTLPRQGPTRWGLDPVRGRSESQTKCSLGPVRDRSEGQTKCSLGPVRDRSCEPNQMQPRPRTGSKRLRAKPNVASAPYGIEAVSQHGTDQCGLGPVRDRSGLELNQMQPRPRTGSKL